MAIRMVITQSGSPNGIAVHRYEEGLEYDEFSTPPMSPDLAEVFLREGWAVDASEDAATGPAANKAASGPSENKIRTRKGQ